MSDRLDEENEALELSNDVLHSKPVECPHCHKEVVVHVRVAKLYTTDQLNSSQVQDSPKPGEVWTKNLDVGSRNLIAVGKDMGLLEPFLKTFEAANHTVPKVPDRAFLSWLRLATKNVIPSICLSYFRSRWEGRIDFVSHQGVGAVLVDGVIKEFIPAPIVRGAKTKAGVGIGMSIEQEVNTGRIENWIRTKYGYVAGTGALWEALQKKNYGEFAKPMIEKGNNY